jgi:Cd2+/Zn2+-exporting ATPase
LTVIQNIFFSLSIKALVMFLAILISVPMYIAIIADVGVALLAVMNALRIMYGKIE